jgi:hypothetical protein
MKRRGDASVAARGTLTAVDNTAKTMTINRTAIYGAAGTYTDWVIELSAFEGPTTAGAQAIAISFAVAL